MFDLKSKVAIVTGSTRGIGKAIAAQLASAGAKVIISGRTQEACDKVSKEMNDKGYSTKPLACHVGDKNQINDLINQTIKEFGGIDILISNAGSALEAPILEMNTKDLSQSFEINFF